MQFQQKEQLDSYLPDNINDIYYQIAQAMGKEPRVIKTVISHSFFKTRQIIRNLEHTGVLIHGLGTFEVFKTTINKNIVKLIKLYREGTISKEKLDTDIKTLWAIRQLAIKNGRDSRYKHRRKNYGSKKSKS